MIYFDNASTTLPKPPGVVQAVAQGLNTLGNPSRGGHGASLNALRTMLFARQAVSDMFNAGSPMRVAFTLNATAALNIAIGGIDGHIVTTVAEHNSVLRPLFRRGNFTAVPLDSLGRLDINEIKKAVKKDTQAVVMCHASNLTGNVFDIQSVGKLCKDMGLKFIVDAAQTAGLLPIDMQKANIDALCISGHKSLYGPQGVGAICLSEDFTPKPLVVGGSGSDSFSTSHPSVMPDALEAGTQNIAGIAGLLAGIEYVKSFKGGILSPADAIARRFINALKNNKDIILYGDTDAKVRTPVVSLNIKGVDSSLAAALLYEQNGIAVRAGAHCAPLMHRSLGIQGMGAIRFSFSHFNTASEVDTAINALNQIIKDTNKI